MINQSRYKLGFAEDADYITLLPIFRGSIFALFLQPIY